MKADERRIRNAFHGLALGEALSWPVMYQQASVLPFWTRRLRRDIETDSDPKNILTLPLPFSLNQDRNVFRLSPASNTEWAALVLKELCFQQDLNCDHITVFWQNLAARQDAIRASIGIQSALSNIRKCLTAPLCGHDQPHYFDDSALARMIPIGIRYSDDLKRVIAIAECDASWTNALEGVIAAKAIAAGIGMAVTGRTPDEILGYMREILHASEWLSRTVDKALSICGQHHDFFNAVPSISDDILIYEYSFANSAVEIIALMLAILSKPAKDVPGMINRALYFPRLAASLPALCGAFAGAINPGWNPDASWQSPARFLRGMILDDLKGMDYLELVETFISQMTGRHHAD